MDAAIAELKKFAEDACLERDDNQTAIDELQAENAELKAENEQLKAKLESVQAAAYSDSVDSGMRERRLKRALYKACANWAMSKSLLSYSQAVKFESYLPTKGAKLRRRSSLWHHCYEQCEAMAEEYK